ncbi:3'(2'),5'-bisphosphate nucleotidase SCDLUD_000860 [Saccharomycodes ludwigii]|uniref:3'(2'),5'-bisphosphate nucleotidase n=1 Tax=Saccharomycodes ludwigii TaxID=36035 RepID=UPI001E8B0BF0|nr:hypothetical protein SCDLUD_000860 [Saccharomycodes ludwigii]KAH3903239.1 hypothetical protein SCDLUD_000860 [Saccharomycodes ludwigii]
MPSYQKELEVAIKAVRRASILTANVQSRVIANKSSSTITKSDASPVTVADYAAQAIVINALKCSFPCDEIVAEESSDGLSDDFLNLILNEINENAPKPEDVSLCNKEYPLSSTKNVAEIINNGGSKGGSQGRFWCLDPIDGTKGFLRGQQFAVCLALIENGKVQLGCVGCPNLKLNDFDDDDDATLTTGKKYEDPEKYGYIFYAITDEEKAYYVETLERGNNRPQVIEPHANAVTDFSKMISVEGVEKTHSSHDKQDIIKSELGINKSVHLDSQVKYCLLALGLGHVYLRLPIKMDFEEKIWDHAAGNALVRAVGGCHTSSLSDEPLDFSKGRTLKTKGVIASVIPANLHSKIVASAKKAILG